MREMPKRCVFDFCSPPRGESVGGEMICNLCRRVIGDGEPMLVVNAALDGQTTERFTGIVWHPECSPIEREHLLSEARAHVARGSEARL